MKTVIHPKYTALASSFADVVNGNYTPDFVFCNKRNVVEKVTIAGKEFVIKRYKRPHFINSIAYRLFRKSKARRAYEYAVRLLECGIDTPHPVAYFETYRKGLFDYGIFISEYVPYKLFYEIYAKTVTVEERNAILDDFVDFMLQVHQKGVVPMDMNAGNIFYHKDAGDGHYRFALTDINRMKFNASPGIYEMAFSFEQCFMELDKLIDLARAYNRRRGTPTINILHQILCCRMKRMRRWILKAKYKKRKKA